MVYFLCKAYDSDRQNCYFAQSLPVRGAWIEISLMVILPVARTSSLPVRGAWIEIIFRLTAQRAKHVAPRAGSVD